MSTISTYVKVCGYDIVGFMELSSDVVTLRLSKAKQLNLKYSLYEKILTRFGQGYCVSKTLLRNFKIEVDGVELCGDVIIIPDKARDDDIIVGREALDQRELRITKEGSTFTIEIINDPGANGKSKICEIKAGDSTFYSRT